MMLQSATPVSSAAHSEGVSWPQALFLLVVIGLVYAALGGVLAGEFVYDDLRLILHNPRLSGGVGLWESLSKSHWGFDDPRAEGAVGFWRPLTVLVLRWTYALGDGKPFAFHLVALALHAAATLAGWRLFTRLLGNSWYGCLTALLFALHPVHVESVAWISALNDPLAGLFVFLCLGSFMRWRARAAGGLPFAAAGWLLCGALAKEQALAGLAIVIVLDLGRGQGASAATSAGHWRAYTPFAIALLLYWLARVLVFGDLLAGLDRAQAHYQLSGMRMATLRLELWGGFLGLLALPLKLEVFRPFRPVLPPLDPGFWSALGALALFLTLALWAWKKRADRLLSLMCAVPAALLPVLVSTTAAGRFPFSDRYLYTAVAPACAALVYFLTRRLSQQVTTAFVVLLAAAYSLRVATRAPVWRNEEALFRAAAAESPQSPYVHWGLGRVLLERYKVTQQRERLDEALLSFLTSLALGHDYGQHAPKLPPEAPLADRLAELERVVHQTPVAELRPDPSVWVALDDRLQANLGQGFCYLWYAQLSPDSDYDTPLLIFEQQTKLFPESYEAWAALGTARVARAEVDLRAGRNAEGELSSALTAFGEALHFNPAYAEAWANQGRAYVLKQEWDAARSSYQTALSFRPRHVPYLLEVAHTAIEGGRLEIADEALAEAQNSEPGSLQPLYLMGVLAAARNQWSEALARFDQVLARQGDHGLAHLQRAKVLVRQNEMTEAVRAFAAACELLPTSFEAHYNQSRILENEGNAQAAEPYLWRAYQLSLPGPYRDDLLTRLLPFVEGKPERAKQLAQLSRAREDWAATLAWLHFVLIVENKWAEGHYQRGLALWRLGREVEARSSYEHTLELEPEHFWANHDLGVMLHKGGQHNAALPYLQKALALLQRPAVSQSIAAEIRPALQATLATFAERSTTALSAGSGSGGN